MKRVFVSLFLLFLASCCFLSPVHAQDASWVDTGYAESMKAAASGDVNSAAYISNADNSTKLNFVRQVFGSIEGLTVVKGGMNTAYAKKLNEQSALAGISKYIGYIYTNPPASSYAFFQDMGQTLGFIPKQAYAQGIGFSGLTSLLPLWKAFRNISYGILALVMVVIGFMVMFRKKIDPKTVVTVQNALPKIVITLILITFSYAIVGILIDLMYILMLVATQLIIGANPSIFDANTATKVMSSGFGFVSKGIWGGYDSMGELLKFLNPNLQSSNVLLVIGSGILWGIEGILISVLLAIAFLFASIRLFVMLLNAYIQIIIALLTGPIQIMMDAIPGGSGFASWIKNLISNLIVFPITAVMLLISQLLVNTTSQTWTPPLLGTGGNGIAAVLGLGVIFIIPTIIKGIQESMKAKPLVNAGGIGQSVSAPFGTVMQGVSLAANVRMLGGEQLWNKFTKPKDK